MKRIKITNIDDKILYSKIIDSDSIESFRETIKEMITYGISLKGIYLPYRNLCGVDFSYLDLSGADFESSNLFGANFSGANLTGVNLSYCNLNDVNLSGANISGANFFHSRIKNCNISNIITDENTKYFKQQCPESGSFIGWKKCILDWRFYIVKLEISENSKRSSATTDKCRCSEAICLEIQTINGKKSKCKKVYSSFDECFSYEVGKTYKIEDFNDDRWNECSTGIHFFMNRKDAVEYIF